MITIISHHMQGILVVGELSCMAVGHQGMEILVSECSPTERNILVGDFIQTAIPDKKVHDWPMMGMVDRVVDGLGSFYFYCLVPEC